MEPLESFEKRRAKAISYAMRVRNVIKHIRIANATAGHERDLHIIKANKFAKRYGFDLPFAKVNA